MDSRHEPPWCSKAGQGSRDNSAAPAYGRHNTQRFSRMQNLTALLCFDTNLGRIDCSVVDQSVNKRRIEMFRFSLWRMVLCDGGMMFESGSGKGMCSGHV